ncbi:MAG: hypothetical protein LRY41_03445 [Candidatus Pacebacteria bacterium]|nr:hypothetical protein [Candidatus Paceibacterota bacterium]MCD8508280.1 hypothetical protein [Candidatus Paceibacterota bacterium]MCD8528345.1 hypothetical protein [Candidatus Paceibacterota bacterium]MCD8563996.1 hypothetical protein [Candidatus Paceibacterota bacterium]
MSIHKKALKVKDFLPEKWGIGFMGIIIVLGIGAGSFYTGALYGISEQKPPIEIIYPPQIPPDCPQNAVSIEKASNVSSGEKKSQQGQYVASKNGSKYYKEGCGGISRIKEENRVFFDTEAEAQAKGLERSTQCKNW